MHSDGGEHSWVAKGKEGEKRERNRVLQIWLVSVKTLASWGFTAMVVGNWERVWEDLCTFPLCLCLNKAAALCEIHNLVFALWCAYVRIFCSARVCTCAFIRVEMYSCIHFFFIMYALVPPHLYLAVISSFSLIRWKFVPSVEIFMWADGIEMMIKKERNSGEDIIRSQRTMCWVRVFTDRTPFIVMNRCHFYTCPREISSTRVFGQPGAALQLCTWSRRNDNARRPCAVIMALNPDSIILIIYQV
jgi:hypothetical protein